MILMGWERGSRRAAHGIWHTEGRAALEKAALPSRREKVFPHTRLQSRPRRQLTMQYAELQVTTNYSFLRGGSHPGELVFRAASLGHYAIGIADRNTLAGVVRAYSAVKDYYEPRHGRIPEEKWIKLSSAPDWKLWTAIRCLPIRWMSKVTSVCRGC